MKVSVSNVFQVGLFGPFFLVAVGLLTAKIALFFSPYAGIIPDELTYMNQAFFGEVGNETYGNSLHAIIYSSAELCGSSWYQCAKGLNLFFELLGITALGLAVFWSSRSAISSIGIFALTLIGPFVMYGTFFMPESLSSSLVYVSFAAFIWSRGRTLPLAVAGIFLGLAAAAKPHPLAIIVGLFVMAGVLWWKSDKKALAKTLLLFGSFALLSRLAVGLALEGPKGLNVFGRYSGILDTVFGWFISGSGEDSVGVDVSGVETSPFGQVLSGVAAFGTNVLPGLLVVALAFALFALVRGSDLDLRGSMRNLIFVCSVSFFASMVLLSALFAAYLELSGSEETIFRTMTRYWEFTIPLIIAGLIIGGKARHDFLSPLWRGVLVALPVSAISLYLVTIERVQTLSDSMLAQYDYIAVSVLSILTATVYTVQKWINKPSVHRMVALGFLMAISANTLYGATTYSYAEKAGHAAGVWLLDHYKRYPEDRNRTIFAGERGPNFVAAFTAKINDPKISVQPYYEVIQPDVFGTEPRLVVAGTETYIGGDPSRIFPVGDSVIYEFGYPSRVRPESLSQLGVKNSDNFLVSYWGAWVTGETFSFTVPEDYNGNTLVIDLIINDETNDTRVAIEFDGEIVRGEVETNQVVTPVTIRTKDSSSWAGKEINVSYDGEAEAEETKKGLLLGFGGFSVFNSN